MKTVQIAIDAKKIHLLDVDELMEFQGNLKSLSTESYQQLKESILDDGYSFVIHWWESKGKRYILDGHQRVRTLKQMREEGVKVPKVPTVQVYAENLKQAKRKVLAGTSQYGKMESQGLYEFLAESGIDWRECVKENRFPEINFDNFVHEYYGEETQGPTMPGAHEPPEGLCFVIDCDDMDQLNDLQNLFEVTNKKISYQKFRSRIK